MQIIPAIDIIEGKCVRLTEGDYAQKKIYNENPLEVAKAFQQHIASQVLAKSFTIVESSASSYVEKIFLHNLEEGEIGIILAL